MENLIYWQGRPVGMEVAGHISWFTNAPHEAMEAYE